MASFNGASLGFIFAMSTAANPNDLQVNAYPGANGLEVLNMGARGGNTTVAGALGGATAQGLAAAEATFRSLQVSGGAYVLVDNLGTSWSNVILTEFRPVGRIYPAVGIGFVRKYEMLFFHVS